MGIGPQLSVWPILWSMLWVSTHELGRCSGVFALEYPI